MAHTLSPAAARWSWKDAPALMARLRATQNHPAHEQRDILTFAGLCGSHEELARHVASCEAQAVAHDTREALASVWGREWLRLSHADQALIVRDCTEGGGVQDFAQYRRDIFAGNLQAYALTQRVRFRGKA